MLLKIMAMHSTDLSNSSVSLGMEAWVAARAVAKKGPPEQWLGPKAAAAGAPLGLLKTALVLEISAELTEHPTGKALSKQADAVLSTDFDRLFLRAVRVVRTLRKQLHSANEGSPTPSHAC